MRRPPSRWWHVFSAVVFLGGAVGAPITMVLMMMGQFSTGEEFFVPGTHSLKLSEPGKYVVWNVVSQFRDGRQYGFSDSLPTGTRIKIVDEGTGKELPTHATLNSTETSGNAKRSSVCSFQVVTPGPYSVIVDGMSEQRLLMVRHSMTANFVWLFLLGGSVSVLGWILAPVISMVVEVRRYRARKTSANQVPENIGTNAPDSQH